MKVRSNAIKPSLIEHIKKKDKTTNQSFSMIQRVLSGFAVHYNSLDNLI